MLVYDRELQLIGHLLVEPWCSPIMLPIRVGPPVSVAAWRQNESVPVPRPQYQQVALRQMLLQTKDGATFLGWVIDSREPE